MPYLIEASAEEVYPAFNLGCLISKGAKFKDVEKDIPRVLFFGSVEQAEQHLSLWTGISPEQATYYAQGNMTAATIPFFIDPKFPFLKIEEIEQKHEKVCSLDFAFVSDRDEPCGLVIYFRMDDPKQWIIGLIKNTNLEPKDRTVFVLTYSDLKPKMKSDAVVASLPVSSIKNRMLDQINSDFFKRFLQSAINYRTGELDVRVARLKLLCRFLDNSKKTGLIEDPINVEDINFGRLFAENKPLDLIRKWNIKISFALFKECLDKTSQLHKQIAQIPFKNQPRIDENLLRLTITLYEEKVLDEHKVFLQEQVFAKLSDTFIWNSQQIELIPFFIKQGYDADLFQLILSDSNYCQVVKLLQELKLTHELQALLKDPKKLLELQSIIKLTPLYQSNFKILLVFWIRAHLSQEEYKAIEKATTNYPLFADAFIALERSKKFTIKELQALALEPIEHQKKSILHHYEDLFSEYSLIPSDLNKLSLSDLDLVIRSFDILKRAGIQSAGFYSLVLKKDSKGQLFRLFLSQMYKVDSLNRKELAELLYLGITKDTQAQWARIQKITDSDLRALAETSHECLVCAQQLQDLGYAEELIALALIHQVEQPGLLKEYPCLQTVLVHSAPHLTVASNLKNHLRKCCSASGNFYNEINHIPFTDDPVVNKNLLVMAVVFYKEKVLETYKDWIKDLIFSKVTAAFQWNDTQIQLIPFLLMMGFKREELVSILSSDVIYNAVTFLKQRQKGLTQNVSKYVAIQEKREQLKFISNLKSEEQKQLCLVLWAKLDLTQYNLNLVLDALKTYPLLTKTLLDLDMDQTILPKDLAALALNPRKHQLISMVHYFAKDFEQHHLTHQIIKELDVSEWPVLTNTFLVLKNSEVKLPGIYESAIRNDKDGQLLRLFVPRFNDIKDKEHRKTLISLIYTGIKKGPISQGHELRQINDSTLFDLANEVHEQCVSVQQLQKLDFNNEVILFAIQKDNEKASRFRKILLYVEEQCDVVHENLRKSSKDANKAKEWQEASRQYRRTLYDLAYKGLQQPPSAQLTQTIVSELSEAEKTILAIVDPENASKIRKFLIAIANFLITLFTLGFANDSKLKRTGNYWFFNQTESGEKVRALNKQVLKTVFPEQSVQELGDEAAVIV